MEILTHSAMSTFKNCRRKYQYRYVLNLVPDTKKASLSFGSAVHKGLELYYLGFPLDEVIVQAFEVLAPENTLGWEQADFDRLAIKKATLVGMLSGYVKRFNDLQDFEEIIPEREFLLPIQNPETRAFSRSFLHGGKIDGLFKQNGQWALGELKTASQVGNDYLQRLKLDTQITSYMDAIQRDLGITISKIIYTILKKPSIRQTQKETVEQYCERLIADYQERLDFYFHREEFYRSQNDLLEWTFEKWETAKDILEAQKTGRFYRNTSMCSLYGQCEYMPLCTQGNAMLHLYSQKAPHEELSEITKEKLHGHTDATTNDTDKPTAAATSCPF